jgi:hypothetical protein
MTEKKKPNKAAAKALAELEALEAEAVKADQAAREASGKLTQARAEHEALDRRRFHLLRDRPELEDSEGAPVDPRNDLGLLEKQRAKVGDLGKLQREYEHARRIEDRCNERIIDYRAQHVAELVEAFTPQAQQAARQMAEALETARAAAAHYRGCWNRSAGLVGPVDYLTTRSVPGGDEIGAVEKVLAQVSDLPVPVPDMTPPQAVVMFPDDRPLT